ncbi:ubiquitin specific protease 47 [Xylocopa sonorina]|uniref:ubiquitin specific protease 47 n=1 Tax=Xylocopa sonorina TaxID=1818115 RepID=UPI00403AF615
MVCRAGQICTIDFSLFFGTSEPLTDRLLLRESTRGKDVYDFIEEKCQIQPDTFRLYLVSGLKMIDLSGLKDKTMSEIGLDFSFDRESSADTKHTLFVASPNYIPAFTHNKAEYGLLRYNPPPSSPNHSSVWGEDDNVDLKSPVKPETCYVGLVNQAMTCYLNSLLQALYMTPEFRNALYNWEYVGSEKDEANSIPYQLQKLFLNLQTSTKSAVETTALTKSFGWDSTEAWQQHDIQELCRVMFDALEQKFKNTEQADLINRLYEGKMIDYVKCLECGTEKSRTDTFLDIPLPVRPFGSSVTYNSVEEALKAFVQYEILHGSNQYHCEKCNKKCDAHKGLKFTKFPYLLTIHLKRFDFDFKTFHRIKLNDKVTFPDILNLNPFIASAPNAESSVTDENVALAKCDDNSITDSGTLDDDCPLREDSLPNSNHSTNNDQDDDEGIEISNGPSTSNCVMHNHENEKNRNSSAAKGPYNYELFSIMIHSGSASGGHYYAYIKDFRTQEWLCFNDQSVTQITHDDIQKTYGGGSTRSYFSGGYSSTNAYMLMYRQIDPVRNTLPMQVQDFPKHIQELLEKMKENEDSDRKGRDKDYLPRVKVYCQRPNDDKKLNFKLPLWSAATLAEMTEYVYKNFCLEGIVSLNQCRLVVYDPHHDLIVVSYEGREHEKFGNIWNVKSRYSLLLEIRDKDQKFEPYVRGGIVTKVYVVNVARKKLLEGPINIRGLCTQTVREYKQVVGKCLNIDPNEMKLVIRKRGTDTILIENDDDMLALADFSNSVKVFVCVMYDAKCNKSFFETTVSAIAEQFENIITLSIKLPPSPSKEMLEELNIPTLEEVCEDKEKPVVESPSKTNVANESHRDAGAKCNEVSSTKKPTEDVPTRNTSPQLGEGEEWHTPEQSNSEDSSLSDSDKTLVGDVPEDDDVQLPYLSSSASNRAIKMLNQVELENWDNVMDDSEYYFKATPYTNHNEKCLKVLVDKRMVFNTLKKNLEPYVGVPSEYFKIYRYFDELCGETECDCLLSQLLSPEGGEKLWIKIERALRNGEFTVKLYQFVDLTEPLKFLFEWIVSGNMTVGQAKKEILAEMKKRYDIDIPYERCRLREKCFVLALKVLLDHQKFKDFQFYSQFEIIVQELPDKDPVINSEQVIVVVRRWFPSKVLFGPPQEIVLDKTTVEEIVKKLSAISDIPEKYIDIARGKHLPTTHTMPIARIQNDLDWIGLTTGVELSVEDGDGFFYRDNRETSQELSMEENNRIVIRNDYLPLSSASRYNARKEKALRIYLDGE